MFEEDGRVEVGGAAVSVGDELVEGVGEDVAGDVFAVDLDRFEEGLVEEAAFGRVGAEVGGLDVVGELEREVEGLEAVSWSSW